MAVKKWEQMPLFDLDSPPVPEVHGDGPGLDSEPALFDLDAAAAPEFETDVAAAAQVAVHRLDAEADGEPETGESSDADGQSEGLTSSVSSASDTEPVVPQDKTTADVEPEPEPAQAPKGVQPNRPPYPPPASRQTATPSSSQQPAPTHHLATHLPAQ